MSRKVITLLVCKKCKSGLQKDGFYTQVLSFAETLHLTLDNLRAPLTAPGRYLVTSFKVLGVTLHMGDMAISSCLSGLTRYYGFTL